MIGNTDDGTDFPHKLSLTDRQVSRLRTVFVNNSSPNINLWKTQLPGVVKVRALLGRLLGPLLKTGLPLMKNVRKPLTRSVRILLGLTTAVSAQDATIQKTIFGSGMTALKISNGEMDDIPKTVKSLEKSAEKFEQKSYKWDKEIKRWIFKHLIKYIRG